MKPAAGQRTSGSSSAGSQRYRCASDIWEFAAAGGQILLSATPVAGVNVLGSFYSISQKEEGGTFYSRFAAIGAYTSIKSNTREDWEGAENVC